MDFISFQQDPFAFIDNVRLFWKGVNFNIFQKDRVFRNSLMWAAGVCLVAWIVFGFDSTPLQWVHVVTDGIFLGNLNVQDLGRIYWSYYGKEMHYSAFMIYFLLFYALSRSWAGAGVTKSKNIVFSFAGMILSIAVFEWFWILGFATFQNQPWVFTWVMPQLRILLQNLVFTLGGGLTVLYMLTERWHWSGRIQGDRAYFFDAKSWKLQFCVVVSVAVALFWIYYPWPGQQISVQLADGTVWRSSRLFPQTLYTIDLDPGGAVNAGEWFYAQNDAIHAVNTIVKTLWAVTTMMVFRVKTHA